MHKLFIIGALVGALAIPASAVGQGVSKARRKLRSLARDRSDGAGRTTNLWSQVLDPRPEDRPGQGCPLEAAAPERPDWRSAVGRQGR